MSYYPIIEETTKFMRINRHLIYCILTPGYSIHTHTHKWGALTRVIPRTKQFRVCWTKPQVLKSKSMCTMQPPGTECVCVDESIRLSMLYTPGSFSFNFFNTYNHNLYVLPFRMRFLLTKTGVFRPLVHVCYYYIIRKLKNGLRRKNVKCNLFKTIR